MLGSGALKVVHQNQSAPSVGLVTSEQYMLRPLLFNTRKVLIVRDLHRYNTEDPSKMTRYDIT